MNNKTIKLNKQQPCVYKIFVGPGLYYIGGTTQGITKRRAKHFIELNANRHKNKNLQAAYNEFKELKFEILELCTKDTVINVEQKYLDMAKDDPNCLNMCWFAGSCKGITRSDEHKAAVSRAHKGKKYRLGIPTAPESKVKISNALKKAWAEGRMNHDKNPSRGENHYLSKLTEEQVIEIYKMRKKGMLHKDIANVYNITRANVTTILNGRAWKEQYKKFHKTEDNNAQEEDN